MLACVKLRRGCFAAWCCVIVSSSSVDCTILPEDSVSIKSRSLFISSLRCAVAIRNGPRPLWRAAVTGEIRLSEGLHRCHCDRLTGSLSAAASESAWQKPMSSSSICSPDERGSALMAGGEHGANIEESTVGLRTAATLSSCCSNSTMSCSRAALGDALLLIRDASLVVGDAAQSAVQIVDDVSVC